MRTALIALCLLEPVAVLAAGADSSARPVPRPRVQIDADTGAEAEIEVEAETEVDMPDEGSIDPAISQPRAKGMRDTLRLNDPDYATCLANLEGLGVTYTEPAPIVPTDDADCGILRPLTVSEIAPGVAITPAATMRCPAVNALATWTRDFVLPAAQRMTDRGALVSIQNGSGYICRRRNNAPDGKLSEHAFGNAFDVMGFTFAEGPPIAVEPREAQGTMAEAFQDAVRASACLDFSTVLGPGSNASHADHLHLDVIERSRGYRLCEQGGGAVD
ncbi:hypothetical protein LCGC14_0230030 [marine sediment metagenome]|uniref:Extensin family protein n=2 Tax=root TaxID=1 RepID=A0A7V1FLY6_9RHOB|nr:extensin family protein [Sulfitobacter litoralis]HDZ50734.1 extensin family protein [Sulfitobacter litoralis]|tara:strand:- start:61 stop:882 length:822 start_codon:yes stop_codon:yes gene_type:complete